MNLEEWISGNNKDPVKKDIRDIENKWVTESQTFTKKVEEPKPISNNVSNTQLEKKISELTSKVNELENENKTLKAELEKLKSEME